MAAGIQDVLLMKIIANVSQNIVKCSLHVSRTLGGNQPRVPIIFEQLTAAKDHLSPSNLNTHPHAA